MTERISSFIVTHQKLLDIVKMVHSKGLGQVFSMFSVRIGFEM